LTFPYYISLAGHPVLLHSLTEIAAYFIGFRYYLYLQKINGDPIDPDIRFRIIIASVFGALLGSRLLGGLENPPEMLRSGNILLYFYRNKTVLGGLLGGLFAVEFTKKLAGEKKSSGDLFVFPILLALIIGRIGCFSMGIKEETYGLPTTLPWGMNLGDGLKRHPVALYEMIFLAGVWVAIVLLEKHRRLENGMRFKIFLIAYLLFRFLLDFIKPHYTLPVGLSSIQIACAAGLLYYLYILGFRKTLSPQTHP
jgi:prolipoprotein diacylglyceryltransferase